MNTALIRLQIVAFIILSAGAFFFVAPRIFETPNPNAEARFQIHLGDGCTEAGWVMPAIEFWSKYGVLSTFGVPCIHEGADGSCDKAYLHYPPTPFVSSYVFMKATHSLIAARWMTFVLTALGFSFALALLGSVSSAPFVFMLFSAVFLAVAPGFWLYSDHLFWHGVSLSLIGIGIGLLAHGVRARAYGILLFITMWINPEPVLPLVLLPLVCGFLHRPTSEPNRAPAFDRTSRKSLFLAAIAGVAVAMLARVIHAVLYVRSVSSVASDFFRIIQGRMSGNADLRFAADWTWGGYLGYLRHGYGYFMMKPVVFLVGVAVIYLFVRARSVAVRFVLMSLAILSWNFVMLQHSHHFFALRQAVWIPVLCFYFVIETFGRRVFD